MKFMLFWSNCWEFYNNELNTISNAFAWLTPPCSALYLYTVSRQGIKFTYTVESHHTNTLLL